MSLELIYKESNCLPGAGKGHSKLQGAAAGGPGELYVGHSARLGWSSRGDCQREGVCPGSYGHMWKSLPAILRFLPCSVFDEELPAEFKWG